MHRIVILVLSLSYLYTLLLHQFRDMVTDITTYNYLLYIDNIGGITRNKYKA